MPDMARSAIQPHVAMALNEVERLAQSVHRLRDFAQSSRSAVAAVNVDVVIEQVLDLTAQWIATRLIKVERHDLTTVAERQITANPDHLKQLLLNLVLNAIDVMPHGGTLRLDTLARLRTAERGVCIAISDTGPDIPAALLPHVFEPFHAVRANDSSLGLSICYELAASLGGEITVTSEPGQATTFVVWLPNSTGEKTT
jgi:two-component system NtrC family sensor kinase